MICSQLDIKLYENFRLNNFNTLKISSMANKFYKPDNYGEMISLIKKYRKEDITPIILGAGSNVLFSSQTIEEPIIYTGEIGTLFRIGSKVTAEAGVRTQRMSKFALDRNLSGFEFLVGIPATLGGAIYMNAGAHGQTISDKLICVKVYDIQNNIVKVLKKEELGFSYRHSILKDENLVLLSARFDLSRSSKEKIQEKMEKNIAFRREKQPNLANPNAGSVFKNPSDCELSAGALIEQCGLKGFKMGDCQVWEKHCNFIVNNGKATSVDYTNIVFEIHKKVKEKFGVKLTPEIIYIGKMTKEEEEKWKILKS